MSYYICKEVQTDNGGHLEPVKELILCKDCRFRDSELACTQFDAYTSAAGDLFMPPDWFYCGYGKRKKNELIPSADTRINDRILNCAVDYLCD